MYSVEEEVHVLETDSEDDQRVRRRGDDGMIRFGSWEILGDRYTNKEHNPSDLETISPSKTSVHDNDEELLGAVGGAARPLKPLVNKIEEPGNHVMGATAATFSTLARKKTQWRIIINL